MSDEIDLQKIITNKEKLKGVKEDKKKLFNIFLHRCIYPREQFNLEMYGGYAGREYIEEDFYAKSLIGDKGPELIAASKEEIYDFIREVLDECREVLDGRHNIMDKDDYYDTNEIFKIVQEELWYDRGFKQ